MITTRSKLTAAIKSHFYGKKKAKKSTAKRKRVLGRRRKGKRG